MLDPKPKSKPFVVVIDWNDPDVVNAFFFGATCVVVLTFISFFGLIFFDEITNAAQR
jgi:hypothetical protein